MSIADEQPILGGMHICRPRPHLCNVKPELALSLMSDLHIGAAHVDYRKIQSEINEALENEDRILINGDLWDFILPKDKKRYNPSVVHPRLRNRNDIVNGCIDWATELLKPVAHLIDMIGVGNHETAIEKHHSMDPTLLLIRDLEKEAWKKDERHVIHYGGYCGFVDYRLQKRWKGDGGASRWILFYHHGSGGNSPVTKGMIDFNRKDVFVDADLLWMGHKHNRWNADVEKVRCPREGDEPDCRSVRHVMTGAYFATYAGQSQASVREHGRRSNYAADAGLAPGGKGGARVLVMPRGSKGGELKVKVIQ